MDTESSMIGRFPLNSEHRYLFPALQRAAWTPGVIGWVSKHVKMEQNNGSVRMIGYADSEGRANHGGANHDRPNHFAKWWFSRPSASSGGRPSPLAIKKKKTPQSPNPFHVEAAMVDHGPPDLQNRHSQSSARGLMFQYTPRVFNPLAKALAVYPPQIPPPKFWCLVFLAKRF